MIETSQLYAGTLRVLGIHRLQQLMGFRKAQSVYKLAADRLALDTPVRDDVQRITSVVEALAAHPNERAVLVMWEMYFKELFNRVIRHQTYESMTAEDVVKRAQELCVEVSDVLRECKPGYSPGKLVKESSELIAVLEKLVGMAEVTDDVVQLRRIH
jgi:hypothetical protein